MKSALLSLGLLICSAVAPAAETMPASTAYDANPQHLWNQLNSVLFARVAPEGTVFRDPFKRVLLQRDLWELFDWAAMPGETTYPAQRAELEGCLAVGTEWALVRRLCVIDGQGRIRPTSLAESIQLRRYDSIEPLRVNPSGSGAGSARPAQQMFEFDMDRRREGALKALALGDTDFQFVHFMSQGGDPFELLSRNERTPNPTSVRRAALATCYQCHTPAGILSVASFNRERFSPQTVQRLLATTELPPQIAQSYTPPPNEQQEIEVTVLWKYRQFDWGLLQGLWRRPQ